ncbi:hypothetical protein MTR_4g027185 [Medicago truncatula]|uniref:Uncharacterized protein n=1 Tax=Medicago truncatula TaxID=3880 RepID=A0A072UJ81_MEDTR|nr:hypothetical protein MTR_4g027185 [Medicago truncatula]
MVLKAASFVSCLLGHRPNTGRFDPTRAPSAGAHLEKHEQYQRCAAAWAPSAHFQRVGASEVVF